ncbi:hypothetical protein GCM10010271_68550 [Streptomyces kurssanovii]|nr:hypothetical protein GCM10010271_68550 [Streptomyces kurssanovii]
MTTAVRMSLSPSPSPPFSPPPATRWPTVIWALLIGTFIARAAGFALPFLSYRLVDLGYGTQMIGTTVAVFGAGWLAGQLLCGWLSDRFGRRTALIGTFDVAAVHAPSASCWAVPFQPADSIAQGQFPAPDPARATPELSRRQPRPPRHIPP